MNATRTQDGTLLPIEERRRIYRKRWYENNKEAILKRQSAYQKSLPVEKRRAINKAWRDRNREQERRRAEIKNRVRFGLPEPTRPRPENCECCGKPNTRRMLALDHCHATGAFRGWLCDRCNLGIGKLGDTIDALQMAIDYLKRNT